MPYQYLCEWKELNPDLYLSLIEVACAVCE